MIEIKTRRLTLRRASMEDVGALHAVLSDPACMRFWSTVPHRTIAETRAWVGAMMGADETVSDDFVVDLDGRAIGKIGAWRLPEIGFIFDHRVWRLGYAREAGEAFLDHARSRGLDHLTADVDPRNDASIALLGALGFVETGRAARTFLIGGEWSDSIYFRWDAG